MDVALFENPQLLRGQKIGGLTLTRWLDTNDNSLWYEAQEDAGEKRLVYVYKNSLIRDKDVIRIHNFHTTLDETLYIDGCEVQLFLIVGEYRMMMENQLREYLMCTNDLPLKIKDWQAEQVLGRGYKGVTFIAKKKAWPGYRICA